MPAVPQLKLDIIALCHGLSAKASQSLILKSLSECASVVEVDQSQTQVQVKTHSWWAHSALFGRPQVFFLIVE